MAIISCDNCQSDNDIHLEGMGPDGSRILRCGDCGHTWSPVAVHNNPTLTRTPFEMAQGRFANAKMVDPSLLTRVNRLKTKFLKTEIEPDPAVADYYARCRELFSVEGLDSCKAQDLKDFDSNPMGANPATSPCSAGRGSASARTSPPTAPAPRSATCCAGLRPCRSRTG